jgi:hypothetical protein
MGAGAALYRIGSLDNLLQLFEPCLFKALQAK